MMVMSSADSTFFTLNPVATVVWQAADGVTPLSDIVTDHVCAEFEVDRRDRAPRCRTLRRRTLAATVSCQVFQRHPIRRFRRQPHGGRVSLMQEMSQRALDLGVPMSVHFDITYRCNERCVHCYLDHDDHGEMTTAEIKRVLDELADAGTFFLTFSGGEVLMRRDFFELLEYARSLMFAVRIKTNAVMIGEAEARRMLELGR